MMPSNIIIVQQLPCDKTKHILDDSGRLHWDILCMNRPNKASAWSTDPNTDINSVDCPRCLVIFDQQNKTLSKHGLQRSDARLLFSGLSRQGNIKRDIVQHLIDVGIFTGNPGIVGWWQNGKWVTKECYADWVRCELTQAGHEIATAIWSE